MRGHMYHTSGSPHPVLPLQINLGSGSCISCIHNGIYKLTNSDCATMSSCRHARTLSCCTSNCRY